LVDAWFELNYRLQEEAIDTQINRTFVEQWTMRLLDIVSPRPECFWLFLARINELGLLCASRYVDCCEFSAADELLVEPGSLLLEGERVKPLSREDDTGPGELLHRTPLSGERGSGEGRGWNPISAVRKAGPLLPSFYGLLKRSGYMTEGYLHSVSRRMEKIAQVAGMLMGLGMEKTEDISRKLSSMDPDERTDFRSRLCLFDRKTFNDIGRALHLFMVFGHVEEKYVGKYLRG